jgi:hypothetical protein
MNFENTITKMNLFIARVVLFIRSNACVSINKRGELLAACASDNLARVLQTMVAVPLLIRSILCPILIGWRTVK